jgi:DNA-binding transcriptional ArsR family regulator
MQDPTQIFRALADPTRRQILKELKKKDLRAGEITAMFNVSFPSISRHLSILKAAGLVQERRDGNSIIYRVNSENLAICLSEFISAVCPTEMIQRSRSRKKS